MTFLFVGDLHIKSENRDEVELLLTELLHILADRTYTAIILGGDVMHYHERLFTQPLNQAIHFIQTLAAITKVYVLVGNHDYINNNQFLTRNHWMNALKSWKNVVVVDKPLDEGDVMFVPYTAPGRFIEAMDTVNKRWNYKQVIFCHQEFRGCKMGAIISTDGDEWDDEFPLVVSGHIHDHQLVGKKIVYPGTPLQHAFGDSTIRKLCEVAMDGSYRFIDLNVPRKHILKCDVKDLSQIVDTVEHKLDAHDKIRVKIEASTEEFALLKKTEQYKQLVSRGVRIQLKQRSSENQGHDQAGGGHQGHHFLEVLQSLVQRDEPVVGQLFEELIVQKT